MSLDPVILSRVQFVWVVAWHILLPAFTVGLASYIAVLEGLALPIRRRKGGGDGGNGDAHFRPRIQPDRQQQQKGQPAPEEARRPGVALSLPRRGEDARDGR